MKEVYGKKLGMTQIFNEDGTVKNVLYEEGKELANEIAREAKVKTKADFKKIIDKYVELLHQNKTSIHKEIVVDYTLPELICSLNKKIYLQPIEILIEGQDLFPVQWKIELYKNSELYKELVLDNHSEVLYDYSLIPQDEIRENKND